MTGWRLAMPATEVIFKTDAQNPSVCDHVCSYDEPVCGGRGAENGDDDVAEMREQYNQRRRYPLHAFAEMGRPCF